MRSGGFSTSEHLVLATLTTKVRLASIEQLCRLTGCEKPLGRLMQRKLLYRASLGLVVPEVAEPLWTWRPGESEPAFHELAWQLEKRQARAVTRWTVVYWAAID